MRSMFARWPFAGLLFGLCAIAAAFVSTLAVSTLATAASNGQPDGRPELRSEISTGGLIFSANVNLTIDQQDLTIGADAIQVAYAIRNTGANDQTITIAFPLADIDGSIGAEAQAELSVGMPANFMDFVLAVDGRRPAYALEQRAVALGLDVTKALADAGLPLFPLSAELTKLLADLEPAVRNDLVERGVLRLDDDTVFPAWTLKTTAYWRQAFPAGQTLALSLNYKPIAGRNPFSSGALQPLKKAACVDATTEQAIMRLASGGAPLTMISIGYNAHPGAEALGPVAQFRLTIDKSLPQAIIATCRQGLIRSGPATSDWTAVNYAPDEEFRILLVR
jgi:hypothetical protein